MQVITRQEGVLNHVAKSWKRQMFENNKWCNPKYDEKTYNELLAMKPVTKEAVTALINHGWTDHLCDECHKDADALVALRDGRKTIMVCRKCLNSALKLINKELV